MILDFVKCLHVTPKAQPMKENMGKLDFIKTGSFCSAKATVKKE